MWYPHVTVATVVQKDDRFLLVREMAEGREVYNQPAGHLEPEESLAEAAMRETREETGWLVQPTHLLGLSQYTAPANGVTYLRTTFIAEPLRLLADARLDEGILAAEWLSLDEITERQALLRSPLVLQDIHRFLRGERFPLELIQEHR
jgi:ADP-ribose pyrophosphatase YjhB (NUDIX family)